ncbi:MAG: hypothetical protein F6J90_03625 [Moorea sp. SIOASIH]|nr:hypothetical protein [Moorena sp. SIOASIH]NEO95169.1 hypothetical protein [Moorena sp. SIO3G5]
MDASHICKKEGKCGEGGEIGRWGDGEMGEIFINGNCYNMILCFYFFECFCMHLDAP